MFGGRPITLFHVRGIRIAVDWSWFLILFLVIFWMSQFYEDLLGPSGSSSQAFLLAVLTAVGFFGSILLHELDRKSTRLNSSHRALSRMPSSA